MPELPNGPNNTPTSLYNPFSEDFTTLWDGKPYTIKSREIDTFPKWLADHIKKGLAEKYVQVNTDYPKITHEDAIAEALAEIEVPING